MRYAVVLLFALIFAGCGPHDAKHYKTRGQAQHFPNCRTKCSAITAADWHERRR